MIQNMSFFCCPNCNHSSFIFGKNGVSQRAEEMGLPLLGSIPLHTEICTTSDEGKPIVISDPESTHAKIYMDIADKILKNLN